MTSAERRRAVRELEACVAKLIGKGWTLESLAFEDDVHEPFRARISVKIEGYDVERKGVM